jgi:hypothetical protein
MVGDAATVEAASLLARVLPSSVCLSSPSAENVPLPMSIGRLHVATPPVPFVGQPGDGVLNIRRLTGLSFVPPNMKRRETLRGNTQMHIGRVSASNNNHLTISIWLLPFGQPTFMFGSFDTSVPGPDIALGEALLHFTESDKPIAVTRHGHAAPMPDGCNCAFMFGAHPEQRALPPLGELAIFPQDVEPS